MPHRPPRLDVGAYTGERSGLFTAVEENRRSILADAAHHEAIRGSLANACARYACTAPIYIVMPDHVHVLLLGMSPEARLDLAFTEFKRATGNRFLRLGRARWQNGFDDRMVRGSWVPYVRYVARNPYRAGLLDGDTAWPFCGSVGHDLNGLLWDAA